MLQYYCWVACNLKVINEQFLHVTFKRDIKTAIQNLIFTDNETDSYIHLNHQALSLYDLIKVSKEENSVKNILLLHTRTLFKVKTSKLVLL